MKKILHILLFIPIICNAQIRGFNGICSTTRTYDNACAAIPSNITNYALNFFIQSEINNGNWSNIACAWLLAQDNQSNANINIINPVTYTASSQNSCTWTSDIGYTGNGSNMWVNLGFNPYSDSSIYKKQSAFLSMYVHTCIETGSSNGIDIGATNGSFAYGAGIQDFTIATYYTVNSNTFVTLSTTHGIGLYSAYRTAQKAMKLDLNNINKSSSVLASTALYNNSMNILHADFVHYSHNTISFVLIGNGSINGTNLFNDEEILRAKIGY